MTLRERSLFPNPGSFMCSVKECACLGGNYLPQVFMFCFIFPLHVGQCLFFLCPTQRYQLKRPRKCPLLSELSISDGKMALLGGRVIPDTEASSLSPSTPTGYCARMVKREKAGDGPAKLFTDFSPFILFLSSSSACSSQGSFVSRTEKLNLAQVKGGFTGRI